MNRRVSHGGFMLMYRIHKNPPIILAIFYRLLPCNARYRCDILNTHKKERNGV